MAHPPQAFHDDSALRRWRYVRADDPEISFPRGMRASIKKNCDRSRLCESLPSPNIERDEIALIDPLAVLLLGEQVGDEIEIPSSGVDSTVYGIREIRDKYVQAHFRSQQVFETMFPGHPWFGSFRIDESKGDDKFKPLFDSIKKRGENGKQLLDL